MTITSITDSVERLDKGSSDGSYARGLHRPLIAGGTATILTQADSGALCLFDTAAGTLFTLPSTPVVGTYFDFGFTVKTTGEYKLVTGTVASEFLLGFIVGGSTDVTEIDGFVGNGSSHVSVSMNGTTTGGDAGGNLRVTAISATQWYISGNTYGGTATPATPFDTT